MSYQIQANFFCETCIKCGNRPHIEQSKNKWHILCPNESCKNVVKGAFLDFDAWNRINKKDVQNQSDIFIANKKSASA
jgi:hypothetical protein